MYRHSSKQNYLSADSCVLSLTFKRKKGGNLYQKLKSGTEQGGRAAVNWSA